MPPTLAYWRGLLGGLLLSVLIVAMVLSVSDIGETYKGAAKENRLLVRLDQEERRRLEEIAALWGVPLAGAIRRLIREENGDGASPER